MCVTGSLTNLENNIVNIDSENSEILSSQQKTNGLVDTQTPDKLFLYSPCKQAQEVNNFNKVVDESKVSTAITSDGVSSTVNNNVIVNVPELKNIYPKNFNEVNFEVNKQFIINAIDKVHNEIFENLSSYNKSDLNILAPNNTVNTDGTITINGSLDHGFLQNGKEIRQPFKVKITGFKNVETTPSDWKSDSVIQKAVLDVIYKYTTNITTENEKAITALKNNLKPDDVALNVGVNGYTATFDNTSFEIKAKEGTKNQFDVTFRLNSGWFSKGNPYLDSSYGPSKPKTVTITTFSGNSSQNPEWWVWFLIAMSILVETLLIVVIVLNKRAKLKKDDKSTLDDTANVIES